jgi:hypothetical protein
MFESLIGIVRLRPSGVGDARNEPDPTLESEPTGLRVSV